MIVAGKCPPEKEELRKASERGFEKVELYLEKKHLDNTEGSVEEVKKSPVEVVSVHTPHVSLEEKDYFLKADKLSSQLNAFLVFHSKYLHHTHVSQLENLKLESNYGYENNPGASARHVKSMILEKGHRQVLDTAHLYMAEREYLLEMENLLEEYTDQINVIHLCDSTRTEDGLALGEGGMDMEEVCRTIYSSDFDGIVVLEVMPGDQEDALRKWRKYTS